MTGEPSRHRRVGAKPLRLAAIGGAAIICLLSVSGAIGLSPMGSDDADRAGTSSTSHEPAAVKPPTGSHVGARAQHPVMDKADNRSADQQDTDLPPKSGTGKRVVFDVGAQRVWLVDAKDAVLRTYLVSGSKFDNLDLGTYHVYSRSRTATAYNSDHTMSYMVRFASGRTSPIGFHSIPAEGDGTLVEARTELGTPQSDGCIRQWITDAKALWDFAPTGTTVVVHA